MLQYKESLSTHKAMCGSNLDVSFNWFEVMMPVWKEFYKWKVKSALFKPLDSRCNAVLLGTIKFQPATH